MEGMDNDMMMTLAGAGIILLGLFAVILVRRRRQSREMATAFNDTQVGT
jgi:LPXTG-motif cell wall-anchored protein